MKIIKWFGISVLALLAVFIAIGIFAPDPKKESATTSASGNQPSASQSKPVDVKPVVARPADQCLDNVCIGAAASELLNIAWAEKVGTSNSDLSESQIAMLDSEEKVITERCAASQINPGSGDAVKICKMLARGSDMPPLSTFRPLQTKKVLDFFADLNPTVCQIIKEPLTMRGNFDTGSGRTDVELRFDASGKLRVYDIFKTYKSGNSETNTAIGTKLIEKHPYLAEVANNRGSKKERIGDAPWGGMVTLTEWSDSAPTIKMTAKSSDFDSSQLAACNQVANVNVK
jgi:hypothetical protein